MSYELRTKFGKFLQYLADALDISETRYQQAEERYQAVGKWLGRDESILAPYHPEIYPQGSFRLGTVIKPISDAEEYDIDLVCEMKLDKERVKQKRLKEAVGQEILGYSRANNMRSRPEEGRRCWTLNYADGAQFHLDILPALPDGNSFKLLLESKGLSNAWSGLAIAITDNTLPNYDLLDPRWPQSNPRGYAEWFRERMKTQFDAQRKFLAESIRANIEDIPEYRVRTPLQRAVQILKRHRDIMFAKDPDNKPISIIISTLAAHAYRNEGDLLEALLNIVNGMPLYIQRIGAVSWVANPVNPLENFADKWAEHPQRERNFRLWLQQVQTDLNKALQSEDIQAISELLKPSLGEKVINEALQKFPKSDIAKSPAVSVGSAAILSGRHEPPRVEIKNPSKPWSDA
jgi:Second Messenger Oligonucleotide or Dinucleotide Synthetase domain